MSLAQKRLPKPPASDLPHYCRGCTEAFTTNDTESAHRQALIHYICEHDQETQFTRCNRYCHLVAQPEEIKAGHKLYGPGYVKAQSGRSDAELQALTDMMGYDQE